MFCPLAHLVATNLAILGLLGENVPPTFLGLPKYGPPKQLTRDPSLGKKIHY